MKVPIGHKILNLDELLSGVIDPHIEIEIDSGVLADFYTTEECNNKQTADAKDQPIIVDHACKFEFNQQISMEQERAILLVKIYQLSKLKKMAKKTNIEYLL